ncbi:hypothetical protein V8C42DRAFT_334538, partial [Trichoderma barbatum]
MRAYLTLLRLSLSLSLTFFLFVSLRFASYTRIWDRVAWSGRMVGPHLWIPFRHGGVLFFSAVGGWRWLAIYLVRWAGVGILRATGNSRCC